MKTGYCLALAYLFVVAGIVFLDVSFARAQDPFIITGSDPESGATSVSTTSLVTFTFSDPLDATERYSSGLPVGILDPSGTIIPRIAAYSISPDQLSLTIEISNPEDADFSLVITGATRYDGQRLCTPFVFNYTTQPTSGTTVVSGFIGWVFTKGYGGCNFTPGVIATLLDAPIDQGGNILHAGVFSIGNDYEITHVRAGIFWPYYFWDMDGSGEIEPQFFPFSSFGIEVSFYDGDNDGSIDVISTESGDISGINAFILTALSVDDESPPNDISLKDAYPNPFNPTTTISYTLSRALDVRLEVFDLLGKPVRLLEKGFKSSGEHSVHLDAADLSSGVYFVRLSAGSNSQTKKMVVVR